MCPPGNSKVSALCRAGVGSNATAQLSIKQASVSRSGLLKRKVRLLCERARGGGYQPAAQRIALGLQQVPGSLHLFL